MSFYDDYSLYDEYAPKRYAVVMEAAQSEHLYAVPLATEDWTNGRERLYYMLLRYAGWTLTTPITQEELAEWMNKMWEAQ